jgi:hypothetical protein
MTMEGKTAHAAFSGIGFFSWDIRTAECQSMPSTPQNKLEAHRIIP